MVVREFAKDEAQEGVGKAKEQEALGSTIRPSQRQINASV
jgi:hypothetical protein